ncbi:UNVERIFIED_CONTAM: hypothetical protein GTU68_034961 [Idotea baltica]|nr:hypothetical protein [Idotea baltica]
MLVCIGSNQQVGSVSGGCVEEDLLARLEAQEFDGVRPTLLEYGVSAAENERLGLPCGGKLTLLLQQLRTDDMLSELALAMDYEVMVTDTRAEVLAQWQGPDIQLLQGMPDDIVKAYAADRFSIVITLTHDPRIDDMALMEALTTDAWYVGALGSVRTTQLRIERLRQLQLNENQIAKLHAPVGMEIGSKTPIEIAVAIMAELTHLRRTPKRT